MLKKYITHGLGIALGASLLAYFTISLDWNIFTKIFNKIDYTIILSVVFLLVLATVVKAIRFELLLRPSLPKKDTSSYSTRLFHCWHAICVGYFGNFIFPARAGEAMRVFQIHKTLHTRLADTVSTAVVDRLFDVWSLFLLGGILISTAFTHIPFLQNAIIPMTFVGVTSLGALFMALLWPSHTYSILRIFLHPFPYTLQKKIGKFLKQTLISIHKIGLPGLLCSALFFSVCSFAVDIILCYQVFSAFGWELSFKIALIMELSLRLASSLPSAPGHLGLYQAAAVFVLVPLGYNPEDGIAFALSLQALSLIVFTILGGSGFLALRKNNL